MIELRTGVPGSGKTLSMVVALAALLKSWGNKPEEARPIFVHNVKNLALPHAELPVKQVKIGGKDRLVPMWEDIPDGSLIIIDECQDLFPPRSSQSEAPEHIAWFNTHRHKGMDLWLTTQAPKLIDFSVRALVGKHVHYRRLFGGQRSATYEWDACSDNLGGMSNAVMGFFPFPKKAYEFYKSAEIHTKQSFKLPRWLLIPLAGVALGVWAIPSAFHVLSNGMSGKGISTRSSTATVQGGAIAPTPKAVAASSSPVNGPLPAAVASAPSGQVFAGCIRLRDKCGCLDTKGKVVDEDDSMCEDFAVRGAPLDIGANTPSTAERLAAALDDAGVLAFMADRRQVKPFVPEDKRGHMRTD